MSWADAKSFVVTPMHVTKTTFRNLYDFKRKNTSYNALFVSKTYQQFEQSYIRKYYPEDIFAAINLFSFQNYQSYVMFEKTVKLKLWKFQNYYLILMFKKYFFRTLKNFKENITTNVNIQLSHGKKISEKN